MYLLLTIIAASSASAGDHPAGGSLNITKYSHSKLKNGTICEGSEGDRTLKNGKQFDEVAVKTGQAPKTVALHPKHNATGCKLTFEDGPWAGQTVDVDDLNGHDTIDIAIDTRESKDKAACKKVLEDSTPRVKYKLTECPGSKGTKGPAARAPGSEKKLQ